MNTLCTLGRVVSRNDVLLLLFEGTFVRLLVGCGTIHCTEKDWKS